MDRFLVGPNKIITKIGPAGLLVGVIFLWLSAFYLDIYSAINVWSINQTYNHCFFVLPGALYLIWRQRSEWVKLPVTPAYNVLFLLAPVLMLGLLGKAGEVQLFSHIAAFSSFSLLLILFLGWRISAVIRFPLVFILFAVPVGAELVPLFQEMTADIALWCLGFTNVPVYREGLYINIPAGRFVVAEACSGVQFFIACLAFSAIYAHFSFTLVRLKVFFMLLAIVLPILANGVRVFLTVLVGQYFGMEYADGVDHLVFGWVFFSFILLLLILCGECVQLADIKSNQEPAKVTRADLMSWWQQGRWGGAFVVILLLMVAYIGLKELQASNKPLPAKINVELLPAHSDTSHYKGGWRPYFSKSSDSKLIRLIDRPLAGGSVELFIAWYKDNQSGAELVSNSHRIFDLDKWSVISQGYSSIVIDDQATSVNKVLITNPEGEKRIVLYWYELENTRSAHRLFVKLHQALNRMVGVTDAGAVIAYSSVFNGKPDGVAAELGQYIPEQFSNVRSALPFEVSVDNEKGRFKNDH
ncbi:EpsI family protein [Dasania sp. GY-MA-18]|uniref:EpsI family protein n=1 Tax=Dasania phycosphaerae TaxID=2950436 RepID=A0A9J6RPN5_9GAMM|nr:MULTISPECIES: exosortase A [Dasania]MCR8924105.1 EpsI family protein [Dasania sp. GY-MA-18]MCZ0866678.1 EpsI family protein [Dasania phycosphaerae]MCZ0870263.1 EpsI family protein [Dasania phycosphaerae]